MTEYTFLSENGDNQIHSYEWAPEGQDAAVQRV